MTNMFYAHGIYSSIVTSLICFGITCVVSNLSMGWGSGLGYLLREDPQGRGGGCKSGGWRVRVAVSREGAIDVR